MYEITITIEGLADYLFNRMTEADLAGFRGGQSGGNATDEQRRKASEGRVYADDEGLFLPAWTIKRVLLDGANAGNLKLSKKPLARRLAAVAFTQGVGRFYRGAKAIRERDYLSEVPGRTPPKKGTMTIVRRPALKAGWLLAFRIAVLDDGVPPQIIRDALDAAGIYVGIGAWRPEFGRFIVREFSVIGSETKRGTKAGR